MTRSHPADGLFPLVCFLALVLLFPTTPLSAEPSQPLAAFGRELEISKKLSIGPTMDVTVEGQHLFAIGKGKLTVFDISTPREPRPIAWLTGLGNTRQIAIDRGIAYITAREDGLFIVDVSKPAQPVLLCHYDTIELATGIAVCGPVAYVACRTCGVELIDVTHPARPRHLSTVRTGEAQSVVAREGKLYAGVWGTRELVVCDASNPLKPTVISKSPLDGFGDGVALRGKYCYAVTGHHARGMKQPSKDDPAFGRGHGLEIFDVSDPAKPQFVSRLKLPAFYSIGLDMWGAKLHGNFAFVSDTHNGVYVIDISDPQRPTSVAYHQLAADKRSGLPGCIANLALAKGVIYAAGATSDLYVLDASMAGPADNELHFAAPPLVDMARQPLKQSVYQPDGQVHSVNTDGDFLLVSAGSSGLHILRADDFHCITQYATTGVCFDAAVYENRMYMAEGAAGLSIWKRDRGALWQKIGNYVAEGLPIKQVVVPPPGKFALLHAGPNRLQIVDVSDAQNPKRLLEEHHLGLFYSYPLTRGLLDGRYASCQWHETGFYWYDLQAPGGPSFSGDHLAYRVGAENGLAIFSDQALITYKGKYVTVARGEKRPIDQLDLQAVSGGRITGKPTIAPGRLFCSDRYTGIVSAVDLADPGHPKLLGKLETAEHPGLVIEHKGQVLIPSGYDGLLLWREMSR